MPRIEGTISWFHVWTHSFHCLLSVEILASRTEEPSLGSPGLYSIRKKPVYPIPSTIQPEVELARVRGSPLILVSKANCAALNRLLVWLAMNATNAAVPQSYT